MSLLLSIALALTVAWILARPLLFSSAQNDSQHLAGEHALLIEKKERFVQILKDLDLDRQTGKIAESDYRQMKSNLGLELAAVLKVLNQINV